MGELFDRIRPLSALEWTGERLTTDTQGQVEVEHLHRYFLARDLCRGLDVLDIACGEGYGSALLAQTARSVVGVELDPKTVEHARGSYALSNLRFEQGDARAIPLPDACVDCAVSFETIEHFYEQEAFLAEIRRVLRPGGIFVVSSPERDIYSPLHGPSNPYHVRELTQAEFAALLQSRFRNVVLHGQRPVVGSVILADRSGGAEARTVTFERRDGERFEASEGPARSLYWLAVASDAPLPTAFNSVYFERAEVDGVIRLPQIRAGLAAAQADAATAHAAAQAAQAERASALERLAAAGETIAGLQHGAMEHGAATTTLRDQVDALDRAVADLAGERDAVRVQLAAAGAERASTLAALGDDHRAVIDRLRAEWDAARAAMAEESRAAENRQRAALQRAQADQEAAIARRDKQAAETLRGVREESDLHLRNVNTLRLHLGTLDAEIEENRAALAARDAHIAALESRLARVHASRWWRIRHFFLGAGEQARPTPVPSAVAAAIPAPVMEAAADAPAAVAAADSPVFLDGKDIHLPPQVPEPSVSVVILSYAQVDYTLRCLAAIAADPPRCSIEVIVSDDCSGDPDLGRIAEVANVTFLQPPGNLGFLRHANHAVAQSKGRYVLLLNNDTEPQAGAIDALFELALATPRFGLAGSKLVYPDGRLQEAGGIVWEDASAWNYGRLDDPAKPEFNYVRDVDYVSGASILVPRAVWDELGGFDESYAPAYYEDTDLAFRLRASGRRVLYQPASVVVHHEGISHGTDLASGYKAYQVENQKRMEDRWSPTLRIENYPNGTHVLRARDRAKDRRVVLMIDHYVPEPDRDAGSRNMVEVIKSFQADGWLVKFWPHNLRYDPVYTAQLQQSGVEVFYTPWITSFEDWFSRNAGDIDLLFLSRPTVAPDFLPIVKRWSAVPIAFYGHDLHSARMRLQADVTNDDAMRHAAEAMQADEQRIWREVDVVLYPAPEEVEAVRRLEPQAEARLLIPFCFDEFRTLRLPPATKTVLFVAGFAHPPNIDAVVWLAETILPIVRRLAPDVRLEIVGSSPVEAVKALAGERVEVTGHVSTAELAARYRQARVAVVPLRFGAGVKLKVVEALHEGVPLVTTAIGGQGLPDVGEAAAVRDDAAALAEAITLLLHDDAAWTAQVERQLAYARRMFSREASVAAVAEAARTALDHAVADRSWTPGAGGGYGSDRAYLLALVDNPSCSDADFVERVYNRMLRRAADASGMETYTREIGNGNLSRAGFLDIVESSDEYKALIGEARPDAVPGAAS